MLDRSEIYWPTTTIKQSSYLKGRIGWQGLRASEFIEEGPYLVTGTDFKDGTIDWGTCYHVNEERYAEASYIHLRDEDLLITKDGTIGKIAIIKNCPEKAVLNSGVFLLRCANGSYQHNFLYHLLRSDFFSKFLGKQLNGSTINHLYQYVFEQFEFPIPDIQIQNEIASILDTIEEQIRHTESLITKYQQIKAGMMRDLFTRGVDAHGRLRPSREQTPDLYKPSPVGWIPKEWEAIQLVNILRNWGGHLQTGPFGSQLHAHEYTIDGIPVVMPQNIENGRVVEDSIARIPQTRAQQLIRHRLCEGDIIIARRGELERAAAITHDQTGWVCGTGCFILRLGGSKLDPNYFSLVYRHDTIQRQVAAKAVGTTMLSLNNAVMESLIFPLIEYEEQKEISQRLSTIDDRIEVSQTEVAKLQKIKAGLMHDLLTGHVRIKVANGRRQRVEA